MAGIVTFLLLSEVRKIRERQLEEEMVSEFQDRECSFRELVFVEVAIPNPIAMNIANEELLKSLVWVLSPP